MKCFFVSSCLPFLNQCHRFPFADIYLFFSSFYERYLFGEMEWRRSAKDDRPGNVTVEDGGHVKCVPSHRWRPPCVPDGAEPKSKKIDTHTTQHNTQSDVAHAAPRILNYIFIYIRVQNMHANGVRDGDGMHWQHYKVHILRIIIARRSKHYLKNTSSRNRFIFFSVKTVNTEYIHKHLNGI